MDNHSQTQNHEVVTRTELNFLRATDALKSLNSALETENTELKKAVAAREAQIRSQDATLSSTQTDNNRLRRELENKNDIISDNKYELAQLKTYVNRVGELERQINTLNKRHESEIDFSKYTLQSKDKEIAELNETIEQLEEEIEELNNEADTDAEVSVVEEAYEVAEETQMKMEIGGIIDAAHQHQYQMPEDYIQKKKEAILKLIDGGNISMKEVETLQQVKMNIGGEIKVMEEKEQTEKAILDGLEKNGGRIPESELIKIKGVSMDDGGLVVLAKGGELTLRRNFLHPSFSLIAKKS